MDSILDVKNLSVSFEPTPGNVLDNISFSLKPGERLAILGPSGCGKTTLLRALGSVQGISPKTSVNWAAGIQQPVPIVWQDIRLFPWMTVADNLRVAYPDDSKAAHLLNEDLESVEMTWAAGLWPRQLSRGQSQRIALARSLATGSAVLLLDEPFASVDAISRRQLGALLLQVAQRRFLAFILVTHDVEEAMRLADRIIVLTNRPTRIRDEIVRDQNIFPVSTAERIWALLE